MRKGFFIVLEGPDRSGKSTQAALLAGWLRRRGRRVVLTREPGGTRLSEKIRKILLDPRSEIEPLTELFLYETSRVKHSLSVIMPALKAGKVVISDRFTMSATAYQGYGRGLPLRTVETLNGVAACGLKPDAVVVFNIPDRMFRERENAAADRMERAGRGFRSRVRLAYRKLSRRRGVSAVHASGGIAEIHAAVRKIVARKLGISPGA